MVEAILLGEGYTQIDDKGFDRERAIFPGEALAFIQATQGSKCVDMRSDLIGVIW